MENLKIYLNQMLDSSTPAAPIWNVEIILGNKKPHWNYIDGCMMKAVMDVYKVTKDEKYLKFATEFIDYYVDDCGNILGYAKEDYNCDNINEGKVLFDLYNITGKDKYKLAADRLYAQLLEQPKTPSGNFWHKKIYPNQIWLDGLYMAQPFFMEYEMKFNQRKNYKESYQQFKNVFDLMKDEQTGLFFHGCDESKEMFWANKETGLSKNFWSRSLGWYAMALVDTLEKMDDQLFHEYMQMQNQLKSLLDALIKFQDAETGLFYQVTNMGDRVGNYLETSGSAAIAYVLMKAARLKFVPPYYFEYGKKIFDAILVYKLVLENEKLVLKDICLVAGLGGMAGKGDYKERDGTFEYYISEPRVNDDAKGVAPLLFAYAEVLLAESSGAYGVDFFKGTAE